MTSVLHVVENFNGQAVESWLTRLVNYKGFDSNLLHFDFFLLGIGPGRYSDSVLEKGCKLHEGNPGGASILQMARSLRREVKQGGYDVVHVHQDVMGGIFAVALLGLPVRLITQAHNCWQRLPVGGGLKERVLTRIAWHLLMWRSDAIVGVSRQALTAMTRGETSVRRIDRVIYCSAKGGNLTKPSGKIRDPAAEIRARYGLPPAARILLFLGRLDDYKNPGFALQVLGRMIDDGGRNVYLLVAGDGGLAAYLHETATKLGIAEHFRGLGWVEDPTPLQLAADLLLVPSAEYCGEGLSLAAVEAQGCGLPVLASMSIPEDAEIVPGLFERRSLKDGVAAWAQAAKGLLAKGRSNHEESRKRLAASEFSDSSSYLGLMSLYNKVAHSGRASVISPTKFRGPV